MNNDELEAQIIKELQERKHSRMLAAAHAYAKAEKEGRIKVVAPAVPVGANTPLKKTKLSE